mgnify:CR=1 FL=1
MTSGALSNPCMSTVEQARLQRLALLIGQYGGQRILADLIGKAPAQISQWVNRAPNSRTGKPRAISSKSAREIEFALGKPEGWMDQPVMQPGDAYATLPKPGDALRAAGMARDSEIAAPFLRPIMVWDNPSDLPPDSTVLLKKLDFYLSAGNGGPDPNAVEHTDKVLPFRADFCALEGWTPRTHFTMRCLGESMEPTIQSGAPVVIATDESAIRSGKIYAVLLDGEPLLKRLDKLPGGRVRVRSDNPAPAYAAFEVDEHALHVIGRAVWTPVKL